MSSLLCLPQGLDRWTCEWEAKPTGRSECSDPSRPRPFGGGARAQPLHTRLSPQPRLPHTTNSPAPVPKNPTKARLTAQPHPTTNPRALEDGSQPRAMPWRTASTVRFGPYSPWEREIALTRWSPVFHRMGVGRATPRLPRLVALVGRGLRVDAGVS